MNIVVADDHALVRRGLIEFLRTAEPGWRFREAGGFTQAETMLREGDTQLIIIDLNMPDMNRVASLRVLRGIAPETRMIVLTGEESRDTILECLGAGVHGYLPKSGDTTQILEALRVVVAGGVYVPPTLSQVPQAAPHAGLHPGRHAPGHAPGFAAPHPAPGHAHPPGLGHGANTGMGAGIEPMPGGAADPLRLSGRQQQVLDLLSQGRSTKDIARVLDLGIGTVKVHLAAIYRTLGARNRMEAIVKAGVVGRAMQH